MKVGAGLLWCQAYDGIKMNFVIKNNAWNWLYDACKFNRKIEHASSTSNKRMMTFYALYLR